MPVVPADPATFVEETPSPDRTIAGVPTSVAAFVGWAPEGPTDRAAHVPGWAAYERDFGGLDARSPLGHAVRQFFDNGGADAYIVRLVADAGTAADGDVLDPSTPAFVAALGTAGGGAYDRLDRVDPLNLLCVPGLSDAAALADLAGYCRGRRAFLIADCGPEDGPESVLVRAGGIAGAGAANAALYFPWVIAPDPLAGDRPGAFPPCGFVAGVYARTDVARGVWGSPAGPDAKLVGAAGVAAALTGGQIGTLGRAAVNCIRTIPASGTVAWGGRTLDGADGRGSEWAYVAVRRLALYVEESLARGTRWVVFEPGGEPLWAQVRLAVGSFMQGLFGRGAFRGASPQQAYFVRCGGDTHAPADVEHGIVNIIVGFAPLRPAEFVVLNIRHVSSAPQPPA